MLFVGDELASTVKVFEFNDRENTSRALPSETKSSKVTLQKHKCGTWLVLIKEIHFCLLKVLIIDGRGHLLGRLAAIVAKQVLLGRLTRLCCLCSVELKGNSV